MDQLVRWNAPSTPTFVYVIYLVVIVGSLLVLNVAQRDRLSFPFFFDPNFDAEVQPIELPTANQFVDDRQQRWDQASVHEFRGTYGEYLLNKVSKVFPQLRREVL